MFQLKIVNLSKSYGTNTVFDSLSLEHSGGVIGIAGPNGSGKSTLMRCLAHLLHYDRGMLEWRQNGEVLDRSELQVHLGFAAPYISLYGEMSPSENLRFIMSLRKQGIADRVIDELLESSGLAAVAGRPYGNLSTGQQQRARLAAALVHRPHILLLDEPGTNLDEAGQGLVAGIAERYRTNNRVLVIASNSGSELDLCDRVFSLETMSVHTPEATATPPVHHGSAEESPRGG